MLISDLLKTYLSHPNNTLCRTNTYKVEDFNTLNKALDNKLDNFVLFDNLGGRPFTFHLFTTGTNVLDCKNAIRTLKPYIYAYKLNGKETILKELPKTF